MKSIIRMVAALAALLAWGQAVSAQCAFTPTVTGDLLLCPASSATLTTQQYSAYQWYSRPFGSSNPAQPIPGATGQTLTVNADDTPLYISVAATLNGCTEQSQEVLVDGLAFLPVTVATSGEFGISDDGELVICTGDTIFMVAQLPYTLNFRWYKNQVLIPGTNNDTLVVTTPGNYWLTASPGECPNWTASLGLEIPVIWGDAPGCMTSVNDPKQTLDVKILPNPASHKIQVTVADFAPVSLLLFDRQGKIVQERKFVEQTTLDVADLPAGVYVLQLTSENGRAAERVVVE